MIVCYAYTIYSPIKYTMNRTKQAEKNEEIEKLESIECRGIYFAVRALALALSPPPVQMYRLATAVDSFR